MIPENSKSRLLPFQLFRFVPSQHFEEQTEKNKRTAQPCKVSSPTCDAMFGQKHSEATACSSNADLSNKQFLL